MSSDSKPAAEFHEDGSAVATVGPPEPPVARREPLATELHGDRRVDDYAWLRNKESAEVIGYLNAENAYTDAMLAPTLGLQEKIYREMLGRILQTDLSVPYRCGDTDISRGRLRASNTPCIAANVTRRSGRRSIAGFERAGGGAFVSGIGAFEVSDNNPLLAYSTDTTASGSTCCR